MKKQKKVTVCIVSLNCISLLKKCIRCLKKSVPSDTKILVLDLGSDETSEWCKKVGLEVFKKKLPFYFAQANNFLVSKVKTDLVLFLNPDTEPKKDFLKFMIEDMEKQKAKIVGCRLLFYNKKIQHAGIIWGNNELPRHIGYNDVDNEKYSSSYAVEGVTAACMLIEKKTFISLGGFDESFKNGYEDVDLCKKAWDRNLLIWYCGRSYAIHHEGAVMGVNGRERTSLQFLEHNKKILLERYPKKHDYYFN